MKTCGTCKHFGEPVMYWDRDADDGLGDMVTGKFRVCGLLKHMNSSGGVDYRGHAGVVDGSGYRATFCVSDEFGCNQHAPKSST